MTANRNTMGKQLEILSYQKNFNIVIAIGTIFLVLLSALSVSPSYSRFYGAFCDILVVLLITLLIVIFVFLMKRGFFKKLSDLFNKSS